MHVLERMNECVCTCICVNVCIKIYKCIVYVFVLMQEFVQVPPISSSGETWMSFGRVLLRLGQRV